MRLFSRRLAVLLFLIAFQQAGGASTPLYPLIKKASPFQTWPKLEAKVVGLLSQRVLSGLCEINEMQYIPDPVPCEPDASNIYRFNVDDNSPNAVYFAAEKGQGVFYEENWKGVAPYFTGNVAMFLRTTKNSWGLSKPVHLVDATVNGGNGNGEKPNILFVITDAKVLDGTPGYPQDPNDLVTRSLGKFEKKDSPESLEVIKTLTKVIEEAENKEPEFAEIKAFTKGTRDLRGHHVSWLSEKKLLRVVYYQRFERTYTKSVEGKMPLDPPAPKKGATPPPREIRYESFFGAEHVKIDDYKANGDLAESKVLDPVPYQMLRLPPKTKQ